MFTRVFGHRRAKQLALIVPASLVLVAVAAACGGGDDDDATATPTTAVASPTSSGGNGAPVSGDDIAIEMTDNVFTPSEITVPVNTEVEITVENKGLAVHNMHVVSADKEGKDFASDLLVNPGASSTFEVKFTKTGTYDFKCDYHFPEMVGVITVQ